MQTNPPGVDKVSLIMINNFLALAAKNYRKFIEIPKVNSGSYIEYNTMLFRAHIECRDFKNAETILESLKKLNDEDILVSLCKIEWHIIKHEYDFARQLVQELRDKFEDSAKLLSLAASCFMGKREFGHAEKT